MCVRACVRACVRVQRACVRVHCAAVRVDSASPSARPRCRASLSLNTAIAKHFRRSLPCIVRAGAQIRSAFRHAPSRAGCLAVNQPRRPQLRLRPWESRPPAQPPPPDFRAARPERRLRCAAARAGSVSSVGTHGRKRPAADKAPARALKK